MKAAFRNPGVGVLFLPFLLLLPSGCSGGPSGQASTDLEFSITFSESLGADAQDGRLILILSKRQEGEPRFQVSSGPSGQQVFGMDVEGWAPGEAAVMGGGVFGFPMDDMARVTPVD